MAGRVLHLLSQRPGWTGSGMALNAIVQAADQARWQQWVLLGTSPSEPTPDVGCLTPDRIRPLVFERDSLTYPIPGMSDVMPYRSSRFSELTREQLSAYCDAWSSHLAGAIEEFQPDVIHSHHVWLLSSLVKEIAPSIPVVTHCHGTGLRQLELCPNLAPQVRAGCARNDAFLLLHQGHVETLQNELSVTDKQMSIVGSGFREDVFNIHGRQPTCGPVITYAGKLSYAKGVPWLLEAVERLAKSTPGVVLHVAGSGSGAEADEIRARINSLECVEFHGQLDPQQLADLLRQSSVFVLPSFYEGLPLVLIEAAACGCRIVATELPGVVDQLQEELGDSLELVPLPRLEQTDRPVEADLPEFVARLTVAMETSLAPRQNDTNPERVAGMTWNRVFEKIEVVWRQLIDA
jgi:glycosyltransferase involved in cell wall biosynthesis